MKLSSCLLLAVLASCQSVAYEISIDSQIRADGVAAVGDYYLIPNDQDLDPESLDFVEFRTYVDQLLAERGFTRVDDPSAADLVIGFGFGIDDGERHSYVSSVPVFGERLWVPYSSHPPGHPYLSTWGIVGYRYEERQATEYQRSCELIAWPADEVRTSDGFGDPPRPAWHTEIASRGGSSDLRAVLPAMLWAARNHVATDTGQRVVVQVPVDSPEVAAWRRAARAPRTP